MRRAHNAVGLLSFMLGTLPFGAHAAAAIAKHVPTYTVPASNIYTVGASDQNNYPYRIQLRAPQTAGSGTASCSYFYVAATDANSAQKYQLMVSAAMAQKQISFEVDSSTGSFPNILCHSVSVTVSR